jgi:anti-anti-sigma regulatory factor
MAETSVRITDNGDHVIVVVEGKGVARDGMVLKRELETILAKGTKTLLFDLGKCESLDDTFLGVIMGVGLRIRQKDSRARVLGAKDETKALLQGLGMDRLFDFSP